ncbi:MAG: hypothetical protein R3330_14640, partial [Saprospiraceae bacterium]|nr:hypothetical protein [Saprospiraceae bacterium]
MGILVRAVFSLSCLPLVYVAVLVLPCRWVSLSWTGDVSAVWACSEAGPMAIAGPTAAAALLVSLLVILILVWFPVVRRHRL